MDEKCDHDKRFRGVLFTTNGCLACELEKMISENERLGEKLKELEEGIKKHKAIKNLRGMTLWEGDVELYKLVEGKGGEDG